MKKFSLILAAVALFATAANAADAVKAEVKAETPVAVEAKAEVKAVKKVKKAKKAEVKAVEAAPAAVTAPAATK